MSQPRIVFLDGHTLFSNDLNPDDLNVCGHFTLFRRYRDALSQSAITLLTFNAGVALPNTLAEAI